MQHRSFFTFNRHYRYPASRGQMTPTSQSAIKMGVCGHFKARVRKQEAADIRETGVDVLPDILKLLMLGLLYLGAC